MRTVTIVTPCFNAAADLEVLYRDLERLDLSIPSGRVRARHIVVDNASATPLRHVPVPEGWRAEVIRLRTNTGGSGGYNAGMAYALQSACEPPEFLWLLDSDARPRADTLRELILAIDTDPAFVVMGSAIARPQDGVIFEVGGRLDAILGQFHPCFGEDRPAPGEIVEASYAAACSALVRADAVRRVGLFPEVFLNADDVEWCVRLARETGGRIGATTRSVVTHPQMKVGITRPRYLIARNAFGPIDALGLGPRARLFRALREIPRALAQIMIGREDLAELHLRGLEDAARGNIRGSGSLFSLPIEAFTPMADARSALAPYAERLRGASVWLHPMIRLDESRASHLEEAMLTLGARCPAIPRGEYPLERETFFEGALPAIVRLIRGPRAGAAIIPVRGRPNAWCRGRIQIQLTPDALIVRPCGRARACVSVARATLRGAWAALRIMGKRPDRDDRLPDAMTYAIDLESEEQGASEASA